MEKLKFEFDLLENSYDYIRSSFDLYFIADEYGNHDEQRTEIENKVNWKLAFVTMVQAVELLLKEILYRIHQNLIYEDIDLEKVTDKKTVNFQQALNRIDNFSNKSIESEKKLFLMNCSKLRNEFVHYKVSIQSEQIKSKYCKLYSIYKELYSTFIGKEINYNTRKHFNIQVDILYFNENIVVFRGREIDKNDLIDIKNQFIENSKYKYYITKHGQKVERIRYGSESKKIHEIFKEVHNYVFSNLDIYEICDECLAKQGEFHTEGCDLEVCPVCGGQIISCDCIAKDNEGFLIKTID